ncbi:MAG TPA: YfhO family protein [Polyangia bacterium]|nr:YfhO family protein [Polyangia bacterium]
MERAQDPAGRGGPGKIEVLWCLGILLAAACLLHAEVIFGGHVYHMDDAADGYYPGHIAVARAFAKGELPTWEPGSWCGWPLIVDPYNGVFYPLNVVYYVLGPARGLGFSVVLHVVLGGLGMWWFLRRRRLGMEAALFGALGFALSSFFVVRIRHVIFIQMMAWLPWILVGVEGWLAERRRRALVLVAGATGLALVAGALSIGHFAALAVAAYTVARSIDAAAEASGAGGAGRRALADLVRLGGAALVGVLVAGAQLVPTVAHLPYSPRSLGSDYTFASSYAWPSLRYLVTLVAPDFFGGEFRGRYVGAPNHWELCGWYVGALMVALAPFALWAGKWAGHGEASSGEARGVRRRGLVLPVLAGLVLLAVGLALGDAGPVHPLFFRFVPLYAALRCPARALLMAVLVLPILGAHGAAALAEWLPRRAGMRRGVGAVVGGLCLLIGGGVAWWLWPRRGERLPVELADLALMQLALMAGALAASLALARTGWLGGRGLLVVWMVLLGGDLLATGRRYAQPQPADYPAGMERFGAVEWLRAHADGARFVNDPRGPFRLHNVGMVLGLENASGYDSVGIWRYVDFLYLLKNGRPYPEKKLKHDFAGIGVWNLSSRLLDLMNVRWLIAESAPAQPGPGGGPRWVERFAPRPGDAAPAAKHEPIWNARLRVYENRSVLPRAFVVYRAEVPGASPGLGRGDDDRLAARLLAADFDPGRVALLEEPLPAPWRLPAPETGEVPPPYTAAQVVERGRHEMVLEVMAEAPGLLVASEIFYPGWSVTVDGEEAPIVRTDWAFRGVPLGPGHHRVVFRYRSRPTEIGLGLSVLGLMALLGLWHGSRRTTPR